MKGGGYFKGAGVILGVSPNVVLSIEMTGAKDFSFYDVQNGVKRRGERYYCFVDGVKERRGCLCCDEEGIYPYDWII